jgi:L-aspartate oxidase
MVQYDTDVLVLGSGAAGLSLALRLNNRHRITVISKFSPEYCSTQYAQGGIAAVQDKLDTIESHIADTLDAGAGLCHEPIVRLMAEHAPGCIAWLRELGVEFSYRDDTRNGEKVLDLTREGGHSHRRIAHASDATGKEIEKRLLQQALKRPNIELFDDHIAVDLISNIKKDPLHARCQGAYLLSRKTGHIRVFRARAVVLATGGYSKAYLYTSNPDTSSGDGVAMAWRAGCRVANMEFNQFHPTCLFHPRAKSFLISESVRGEGGILKMPDGTPFMKNFDPRAELAPRDIVARAIDHEMKLHGVDYVLLDISHKPSEWIRQRFPTIYGKCLKYGFDITQEPIPVVPAAHYSCGGVLVGPEGTTDLPGLYAVGEVACNGLHGANRLASNSLMECLVFSQLAANHIDQHIEAVAIPERLPEWDESRVTDSDEQVVVSHNWDELRRFMWDYVGIVRTDKRLERAEHRLAVLEREIRDYYGNFKVTSDLIELRNLVVVAELIIRCAKARKESRGLHYSLNYPERLPMAVDTVLDPGLLPVS